MKGFIVVLIITTMVAYSSTTTTATTAKSSDASAIRDFTKPLSNPPPSWVHGGDVCGGTFVGISCDSSGRVTSINLTDEGLTGTLTPMISSLSALEVLELSGNKLTGTIPSLAGMASLTHLVLSDNGFTSLPYDFFHGLTSLMILQIDNLPLGPWLIPNDIADCTALQMFTASNASIIGALPLALTNLKSLTMLWLEYNYLSGSLPAWLPELSSLEIIGFNNQMSDMKLSGKIDVFASFKNLKQLWIQSNSFSGPIPDFNNSQLVSLDATDNMLTGLVPASLTGLESLQSVGLSNNFLQGPWPMFSAGVAVDIVPGNGFCLHAPGPCDQRASILLEIASNFGYPLELARTWVGNNPCNGSWVGIVCKGSVVAEVNLSGQNFSGIISSAFANLSMLERLDLSENQLKGVVPEALTTLTYLKFLNVSHNDLSGLLPRFKPSVEVVAEGNHLSSRNSKSKLQMIEIIVGSILAVVVWILLACLCQYCLKRNKNTSEPALPIQLSTHIITGAIDSARHSVSSESTDSSHSVSHFEKIPINVLIEATNNFNENMVLGRGGFAVVFKGILNGEPVAVKKFNSSNMGAEQKKEFLFELDVIGKLSHRNLVKLLGYCVHNTERFLVYEYMSAGTLREHLLPSGHTPLTWVQRMKISLDVARGIEYLHGLTQQKFIHRDLNPSNILLDQDLGAKVSDFGLVRTIIEDKSTTSRHAGTYGYLAPEYANTGELSTKIDVYSYGVVLMEIITGRMAIDNSLPHNGILLVPIFRTSILNKEKFRNIIDPTLELNGQDWNSLLKVAELACNCTDQEPEQRPGMHSCVTTLSRMMDDWEPKAISSDKGEPSSIGLKHLVETWIKEDLASTSG